MINPDQLKPQVEAVSQAEAKVHKSRWGYHPVTFEEFQFLRRIHRKYWETLSQAYRWAAWSRKHPRNRVGSEPSVDPAFIDTSRRSYFVVKTKDGGTRTHILPFTRKVVSIVDDVLNARMPRQDPKEVRPIDLSKYEAFLWLKA